MYTRGRRDDERPQSVNFRAKSNLCSSLLDLKNESKEKKYLFKIPINISKLQNNTMKNAIIYNANMQKKNTKYQKKKHSYMLPIHTFT